MGYGKGTQDKLRIFETAAPRGDVDVEVIIPPAVVFSKSLLKGIFHVPEA
jgi:hypothetical protein